MMEDLYLLATVARHRVEESPESTPDRVRRQLMPELRRWGGKHLEAVTLAGSYAKGTAIRGVSLWPGDVDVDLFLSLRPDAPGGLADYQASLEREFREYQPMAANVAVRVLVGNTRVDLVPGRRWESGTDHTLWQSRRPGWVRTNVAEQIRYVRESGCREEILATKIWRRKQGLYFPSFCLELAVIEGLRAEHGSAPPGSCRQRVLRVLEWLAEELPGAALRDPANRSNVVSKLMSESEKRRVAESARLSLRAASWTEVV